MHARGTVRIEQDRQRLLAIIRQYVEFYEADRPEPWSLDSTEPEFIDSLLDAIVGFSIEISHLEGNWKLSQNHSRERRRRVIDGLRSSTDKMAADIAARMEQNLSVSSRASWQ